MILNTRIKNGFVLFFKLRRISVVPSLIYPYFFISPYCKNATNRNLKDNFKIIFN